MFLNLYRYLKKFLSLACMHGYYGENCTKTCGNCLNDETCNNINGTCSDGCSEGFKGNLCITSTIETENVFKIPMCRIGRNDILFLSTDDVLLEFIIFGIHFLFSLF